MSPSVPSRPTGLNHSPCSLNRSFSSPSLPLQWQELAELYLRSNQPSLAAFCYEELVLFQPNNFAFHTALAEAYYTARPSAGSAAVVEQLRLARKHFAQAVELLQGETARPHLRALYGLCTVSPIRCTVRVSVKYT